VGLFKIAGPEKMFQRKRKLFGRNHIDLIRNWYPFRDEKIKDIVGWDIKKHKFCTMIIVAPEQYMEHIARKAHEYHFCTVLGNKIFFPKQSNCLDIHINTYYEPSK